MERATAGPPQGVTSLGELALLFLKLGATSFGGPAVHIAMMEDEVVTRRRWMTRERFVDLVGATNLIPGPNSTEIAIHIGHIRAGWLGLIVAGTAFVLPATLMVMALAWVYVRYGALPETAAILYTVKPVVIAVVAQALWRLASGALKSWTLGGIGLAGVAGALRGLDELVILAGCGALSALVSRPRSPAGAAFALAPLLQAGAAASPAAGLWALFGYFLKIGAILFGSGYVLVAYLRSGLVEDRGWLTDTQLLDAVAIGQVTPGPVSTTATFIGYLLAGEAGAVVATVGIFLPAFVFVALSAPLIPRIRGSKAAGAVLDGVNVAALALMAVVIVQLASAAVTDVLTAVLAIASAVALIGFRVNSVWIVLAAALGGLAAAYL